MSERKNLRNIAMPVATVLIFSIIIAVVGQTPTRFPRKMMADSGPDQVQEPPQQIVREEIIRQVQPTPTTIRHDPGNSKLQSTLLTIAKTALEGEKRVLVKGDLAVKQDNQLIAQADEGFARDRVTQNLELRSALAERQIRYTAFKTDLSVNKTVTSRLKATLWATEYTTLTMQSQGGPPTTEYEQDHIFDFRFQDGEWKLISDQLIERALPEGPKPGEWPIFATPTQTTPSGTAEQNEEYSVMDQSETSAAAKAGVNLNRPAIEEYARRYCKKYNKKYRTETNDCTNFASQCLYAGGSPMVSGWYRSDSVWWYNFSAFFSPYHSYTWGGAHNFYLFLATRPRGTIAKSTDQLKTGDILQVDWNDAKNKAVPDGHIDHTMVVTGKSKKGEIFLTYHTSDTLDRSITELSKLKPKARWYGWRLYDYPN